MSLASSSIVLTIRDVCVAAWRGRREAVGRRLQLPEPAGRGRAAARQPARPCWPHGGPRRQERLRQEHCRAAAAALLRPAARRSGKKVVSRAGFMKPY